MTGSHRTETRSGRRPTTHVSPSCCWQWSRALHPASRPRPQQNPTAPPKPASSEIAPRGQREAKDIAYGDWRKLLLQAGRCKMLCRTSITGKFATGQTAVRLDIVEREGDGTARLQVFAPVGMYSAETGQTYGRPRQTHLVPYTWCLTNACIAGAVADPKMVREMDSGQTLRLEFVDSNLLSLTTSLPLVSSPPSTRQRPRKLSNRTSMNEAAGGARLSLHGRSRPAR